MAFKMNSALKEFGKSAGDNRVMKMAPTKMAPTKMASAMKNEEEKKKKKKSFKDKVVDVAKKADEVVDKTARKIGDTKIPGTNTSLRDAAKKADNFLQGDS